MLYGFFGRVSNAALYKQSLDVSTQRTRIIADRVSKATMPNVDGFALPAAAVDPGTPLQGEVDLEAEMVSLADEQLHFETVARLLQGTYEKIRLSLKDR